MMRPAQLDLLRPPPFPSLGLRERIIGEVCRQSGVGKRRLIGADKTGEMPRLRWAAMVAFRHAGFSTTQIGKFLGGRDHTTVIHGLIQAEKHRLITPGYDEFCRSLIAIVDGWGQA
jgi:hypothetical protein